MLIPVLIVFLVVNVVLIIRAAVRGRSRRPAIPAGRLGAIPAPAVRDPVEAEPAVVEAAPVQAAVDPVDVEAVVVDSAGSESADGEPADSEPAPPTPGTPGTLPGLDDAATWERRIADEQARLVRYRRPVTIAHLEIDGFDQLVELLGDGAGDRILRAMTDTLRRLARDTDHVAHLGHGTFEVLMPETPEEAAGGYVDRVGRASELWLASGAVAARLAIGWAATSGETDLAEVRQLAAQRMRPGPWPIASGGAAPAPQAPTGKVATRQPETDTSWMAITARSWETCRDPDCNHKDDHRRDRQR